VLLPAAGAVLLFTFVYRDPGFRETFRYSLQGLALYPFFIVAIRSPAWWPFAWLNLRAVSFVGGLSYSLYLLHHVVLDGLAPLLGTGAVRAVVSLFGSIALAFAIYELVEKPCARLRRILSKPPAIGASVVDRPSRLATFAEAGPR